MFARTTSYSLGFSPLIYLRSEVTKLRGVDDLVWGMVGSGWGGVLMCQELNVTGRFAVSWEGGWQGKWVEHLTIEFARGAFCKHLKSTSHPPEFCMLGGKCSWLALASVIKYMELIGLDFDVSFWGAVTKKVRKLKRCVWEVKVTIKGSPFLCCKVFWGEGLENFISWNKRT